MTDPIQMPGSIQQMLPVSVEPPGAPSAQEVKGRLCMDEFKVGKSESAGTAL